MFRELTRIKQKLSDEECREVLTITKRGVLSVAGDDGYPYGVPLNHYYDPEDGRIYFHSGKKGHKVDAVKRFDKASFTVYDEGFRKEGDWALNIRSVIIFGRIVIINDTEKIYDIAKKLSLKFTDDLEYIEKDIRKSGPDTLMFALVPEHICGKLVNES